MLTIALSGQLRVADGHLGCARIQDAHGSQGNPEVVIPPGHTHNVTRWRDGDIVQRWVASAWLLTEKHFRRIGGHANLWALAAILGREQKKTESEKEKVA